MQWLYRTLPFKAAMDRTIADDCTVSNWELFSELIFATYSLSVILHGRNILNVILKKWYTIYLHSLYFQKHVRKYISTTKYVDIWNSVQLKCSEHAQTWERQKYLSNKKWVSIFGSKLSSHFFISSEKKREDISIFLLSHQRIWHLWPHSRDYYLLFFIVVHLQLPHLFPSCSPLACYAPDPTVNAKLDVQVNDSSVDVPWLDPFLSFPHDLFHPPLWSWSLCSLFPRLWFYFAPLIILLIRLYL